jgi:hypothetical protein
MKRLAEPCFSRWRCDWGMPVRPRHKIRARANDLLWSTVLWPGHAPSSSPPATQGLGAWGEFAEAHFPYAYRAANTVTEITGVVVDLSMRRTRRPGNGSRETVLRYKSVESNWTPVVPAA